MNRRDFDLACERWADRQLARYLDSLVGDDDAEDGEPTQDGLSIADVRRVAARIGGLPVPQAYRLCGIPMPRQDSRPRVNRSA